MDNDGLETENVSKINERISIRLSTSGHRTVFETPEGLKFFANKELSNFNFLIHKIGDRDVRFIAEDIFSGIYETFINNLLRLADLWDSIQDGDLNSLSESIKEIEDTTIAFPIPLSTNVVGYHIIEVSKTSPDLAALCVLVSLAPTNVPTYSNPVLEEYMNTYDKFYSASVHRNTAYATTLTKLSGLIHKANRVVMKAEAYADKSSQAKVESYLHELENIKHSALELNSGFESWIKSEQDDLNNLKLKVVSDEELFSKRLLKKSLRDKIATTKRIKSEVKRAEESLATSEITFKEKVELNESVGYWTDKGATHLTEMKGWSKYIAWAMLATLILPILLMLVVSILTQESMKEVLVLGSFNPLVVAISIITLSLCTYSIRFSARQYASAKHLSLEANERRTMILTYLALMSEDKLKEQEDRKIALDTLFRPSQTGMVTDNQSIMPTDSVIKIFTNKVK